MLPLQDLFDSIDSLVVPVGSKPRKARHARSGLTMVRGQGALVKSPFYLFVYAICLPFTWLMVKRLASEGEDCDGFEQAHSHPAQAYGM